MTTIEKIPRKFVLLFAVTIIFLMISGFTIFQSKTSASSSADIAYVDFQQLMSMHPDMAAAQQTIQSAADQVKQDFHAKSYNQLQQQMNAMRQLLLNPIRDKIIALVKNVADDKAITLVVDKSIVIYGGQDITGDVGKKITGQ